MTSSPFSPSTPDAPADSWVARMPAGMQPYLRLARADRPVGVWLLWLPCLWGIALAGAAGAGGSLGTLLWIGALTGVGAFVMRSAGCAYNDIVDRDIDAQVARTALRPLPSGQLRLPQAWAFLIAMCLIGLLVLVQFNRFAILVGVASLALVAAYPFMKRVTDWPQAWLGLTFNWGVLVGFAAVVGALSPAAAALYAGGVMWTLGYDTIYAHQDKEDDALIGVKSTALKFGAATQSWLAGFFALTIAGFVLAGLLIGAGGVYFVALAPAAAHFFRQVRALDINDSQRCLTLFKSNRDAGLLLLAAPVCELVSRSI